jgi:galactokinase
MLKDQLTQRFFDLFGRAPEVVAQAPGRIEFVGNHTDYNGGYVMGVAIDKVICCAAAKREDRNACFANVRSGERVSADLDNIEKFPREKNWANYPLGVVKYMIEAGFNFECGFDMTDMSNLPSGAGLSSSAAIEMSSCAALAGLLGFNIEKKTMAQIGRKSENLFVGMPSGILDQGVSAFGEKNRIVFIDCLSEEFSTLPIPANAKFYIFNSTKKHALVDGQYAARHDECMEAAKVLSEGGEPRLLRAFTLEDLDAKKSQMSENAYKRAKHVISENARVLEARECMLAGDISGLGKILYASHESSRTLFENSVEELDVLVDALKETPKVYGARLSGGGFGGAVMALVAEDFSKAEADSVASKYRSIFGTAPKFFECSAGDGAKII